MSGISSVAGSSSSTLLSYLQNTSKTSGISGSSCAGKSDQGGPMGFPTSELQDQGFSGTDLDALLKKIQDAVQSVTSASDGKPDRGAIHDAVTKVLKDAGVDTDKIDSDFKAKGPRPHHKHASSGTDSDTDLDALLESLGVDPAKFKLALEKAVKNAGVDGSIDVSQLFASAAAGSQLDVQA